MVRVPGWLVSTVIWSGSGDKVAYPGRAFQKLGCTERRKAESEVSVDTHRPTKGIEDTGNEDSPLAMTEGGIKPKRLSCQTDDEAPSAPTAKQHGSDRSHEYRGLGGKLQPRSFCTRRCDVFPVPAYFGCRVNNRQNFRMRSPHRRRRATNR